MGLESVVPRHADSEGGTNTNAVVGALISMLATPHDHDRVNLRFNCVLVACPRCQ